jgi:hypothetical protein
METDGFVIDKAIGRWNDEYGFLTFADDHGRYVDCEAYGNGDSGVYPGAASNINANRGHDVPRYAIEISNCYSHHNALGYSGTAGDSVWGTTTGSRQRCRRLTDSAFPDHPACAEHCQVRAQRHRPQQHRLTTATSATARAPSRGRARLRAGRGVPAVGSPPVGILNPGGNYNIWRDNWIYGHTTRARAHLGAGLHPQRHQLGAAVRHVAPQPGLRQQDGRLPTGEKRANRIDVWWDGRAPTTAGRPWWKSEPAAVPLCSSTGAPDGLAAAGTSPSRQGV